MLTVTDQKLQILHSYIAWLSGVMLSNTLCLKKNDNDVPHYNFNAHQPMLIIFGRYIAEWICY